MKKVKYMIYCKILYSINKDVIFLRKKLLEFTCKGTYLTKKEIENYGLKQYINTFFIYCNKKDQNINNVLHVINKIDYLQVLGVIKNNILIINYNNELNNNIIFNYKLVYNIFIIKRIILLPLNFLILNKK